MEININVNVHLHKSELQELIYQGNRIMTSIDDIKAALAQAAADATAEKAEVAAAIQAVTDQLTALQGTIAGGTVVTAADLDGILASIQGIDESVKAITVPAVPAP